MIYKILATNGCEYDVNSDFDLRTGDTVWIRNPFYNNQIMDFSPAPKTLHVYVKKIISKD